MNGEMGLREHNRQRTYWAISNAAIRLFLEKGFDAVPVAEVAAAAGISKPTLFRYFPAKEDLVLHRFADHEREAADVVAGRPAGRTPLDALRLRFLGGLDQRDPVTGLSDEAEVLAFHRLLYGTPSLVARLYAYTSRTEQALADALTGAWPEAPAAGAAGATESPEGPGDRLAARLAAGQIVAVQRILAEENWRRIAEGESADQVYPDAVSAAGRAFGRLESGIGGIGGPAD
ncbi:TetR/AcrR family transcriptional regulator [Streptomyces sp. NBC_00859]|uniref:TetR/AcrR family transcriptional regulator n=1 Tax=Streptomyces sp. NBC_00859 TaxID=2903682 RepID=UPI003868E0A2|nr:TetR/AcrR family transcriptional regulator [Streptomyces sp. NBC_00859]